jgi:hypothetical protein
LPRLFDRGPLLGGALDVKLGDIAEMESPVAVPGRAPHANPPVRVVAQEGLVTNSQKLRGGLGRDPDINFADMRNHQSFPSAQEMVGGRVWV